MIDQMTPRLALPLLQAGQAQKEIAHNEALVRLDLLTQPAVRAVGTTEPPASPADGDAWIVGPAATGAWHGQDGAIAGWTAGGWRFAAPFEGMSAWSIADAGVARHVDGAWHMAARSTAIADPAGGSTIDVEARSTLRAVLETLRKLGFVAP